MDEVLKDGVERPGRGEQPLVESGTSAAGADPVGEDVNGTAEAVPLSKTAASAETGEDSADQTYVPGSGHRAPADEPRHEGEADSSASLRNDNQNGAAQDSSGEQIHVPEAGHGAPASIADEQVQEAPEKFQLKPQPVPAEQESKRKKEAKQAEPEEASQSPFSVTVGKVYDGPLDLLLDLIRKQNIDIYDIPIALITAQFLDYCHQLRQTDVDAAGEFIYVASLLIHIKSKMLLPRDRSDVAAGLDEDPRRELVDRLLEHERFKAAAQMLMQKAQIEEATWTNPGLRQFIREQEASDAGTADMEQEIAADTLDLVRVFQDILERMRTRPVLNVNEESVTVAQMIDYVKRRLLMEDKAVSLRRLLHSTHSERALICMFLAMLELVRLQAVLLHQPRQLGDILVKKSDGFDRVFAERAEVQARDDWR